MALNWRNCPPSRSAAMQLGDSALLSNAFQPQPCIPHGTAVCSLVDGSVPLSCNVGSKDPHTKRILVSTAEVGSAETWCKEKSGMFI